MPRPRYRPGSIEEFTLKRGVGVRTLPGYLASRLSIPVARAAALVAAGAVAVDGRTATVDTPFELRRGCRIRIVFPADWQAHLQPTAMALQIVYEDDALLVLDKPPGIVVHPARGHMGGCTLQNGVLWRYRDTLDHPETTLGPAHRLDKDTSGLVIFSRTRDAYRALVAAFATQKVEKTYRAVVEGVPAWDRKTVEAPLGVDPTEPSRGAVVPEAAGGKPAATDVFVEERGNGWSRVRALPKTGRPHQVRLHLAASGHPILGDRDYHPAPDARGALRQALHAAALRLAHPITGAPLALEAPLPADMRQLLARVRDA